MRLDCQILLKLPPLNLLAGSALAFYNINLNQRLGLSPGARVATAFHMYLDEITLFLH